MRSLLTAACEAFLLSTALLGCGAVQEAKSPGNDDRPRVPVIGDEQPERLPDPAANGEVSLGGILAYADVHSPLLDPAFATRARAEASRTAASPLLPQNPELTIGVAPRHSARAAPPAVDVDVDVDAADPDRR